MIIDVPTTDDFRTSGIDFLNLAWEKLIELLKQLRRAKEYFDSFSFETIEEEGDEVKITPFQHVISEEAYWRQAQRQLATTLSLVEQGTEFLIKGGIVEVSPFLLLAGIANNIPRGAQERDVRFSEFKTVDAQELVKIYNMVAQTHLPDDFSARFDSLRSRRNTIMHTVDPSLQISVKELFVELLEVNHYLLGPRSWVKNRKTYINNAPESVLDEPHEYRVYDYEVAQLGPELNVVIDLLEPAEVRKYFSFNKKQRRYMCPYCFNKAFGWLKNKGLIDHIPKLAQLSPNTSASKEVYCLICEQSSPVSRRTCNSEGCKGNVIGGEYNTCLTCGS